MYRKRYRSKRFMRYGRKSLVLMAAVALALTGMVGGTLAWLLDETAPLKNTFTYGDINITLDETDTGRDGDNNDRTNDYEMSPGADITKDPKVTVRKGSKDAWVFVRLEESANLKNFLEYEVGEGWTALEGHSGVYYRTYSTSASDAIYPVIKDNRVHVKATVSKEMLNSLTSATYPTLTITAYAVQRDASIAEIDTAAEAWAIAMDHSATGASAQLTQEEQQAAAIVAASIDMEDMANAAIAADLSGN